MPNAPTLKKSSPALAPELVNIGGTAAALLAVVASGAALSALAPQTVWFTAASYGAPAGVAFAVYCWVTRRRS
jgi:hypothetical protein